MKTDAELIEQYLKLKAHVMVQKEQFDTYLRPFLDGMATIENAFLERLNERGADNTKTDHGTAYKSTLLNVKVTARDALLKFCIDNWSTIGSDLLQVGATKDAVKQWMEDAQKSNGQPPPGIEVSQFTRVNIRKN